MTLAIDHLVVAARSLEEGSSWIESRLGVAPLGGGKHALMSTHNRLLSLGNAYLEVIAIDPHAPPPGRSRWYALDAPAMHARLDRGPALVHWVVATTDIAAAVAAAPVPLGDIVDVTRGALNWRITVPRDGGLPGEGVYPSMIQWRGRSAGTMLPDSGCHLDGLDLAHPNGVSFYESLRSMGLRAGEPLAFADAEPGIVARIRTAGGIAVLA